MKPVASSALTFLLAGAISAPALGQDEPPPFEEGTDIDYGETSGVELGEDIYSEDDQGEDEDTDEEPTYDEFRNELSPHGRWVDTAEYGVVWVPHGRASWWRPYSYGEWIYTRHGWTFVSYDPWGSIPFHYGRWIYRTRLGWCWIPGYQWSPAWVSWRYGGSYIAWAPLGPTGVAVSYYDSPSLWLAVSGGDFRRPLRHRHFVPTSRINVVFRSTREYRTVRAGPSVEYVTKVTRAPVRRARVISRAAPYRSVHRSKHVIVKKPGRSHNNVVIRKQPQQQPQYRDRDREVRIERNDKRVKVKRERHERHRH